MQEFPHHYTVTAKASTASDVELEADRLAPLSSASPAEFGGPGDRWSPETLLVAAIGDCLILTFRAIARGSGLAWTSFECHVTGRLDAATRIAIRNCAKKLGVANNAAAVLVAMNIGYSASDVNMPAGQEE